MPNKGSGKGGGSGGIGRERRIGLLDAVGTWHVSEAYGWPMRMWPRSTLAVLALVALLAALMPSPAWSCPATGRVGSASFVCEGMEQPCAGSPCCRPVSVPRQAPEDGRNGLAPASLAVLSQGSALPTAFRFLGSPAPDALEPSAPRMPAMVEVSDERAEPHFCFTARHGPPSASGRAPPRD